MTRASRVVADAVAAVIADRTAAAISALDLPRLIRAVLDDPDNPLEVPGPVAAALANLTVPAGLTAELADAAGDQAVRDLARDGWHITALPTTHHPETR